MAAALAEGQNDLENSGRRAGRDRPDALLRKNGDEEKGDETKTLHIQRVSRCMRGAFVIADRSRPHILVAGAITNGDLTVAATAEPLTWVRSSTNCATPEYFIEDAGPDSLRVRWR